MMFRKLYWVTEEVCASGNSRVLGVFTSIPDLVRYGLSYDASCMLRLTLTKLDTDSGAVGCWDSKSGFRGIEDRLQEFVRTDDFTDDHCRELVRALNVRAAAVA